MWVKYFTIAVEQINFPYSKLLFGDFLSLIFQKMANIESVSSEIEVNLEIKKCCKKPKKTFLKKVNITVYFKYCSYLE